MFGWGSKTGISVNYTLSSSPTFTAEPWSVYTARPKSTSSSTVASKVSVFIFDKRRFEGYLLNHGIIKSKSSEKRFIEEAYDILRNQISNLARMKHPNILTLIEPLEEHSKNFMFATEYVTGSLESMFSDQNDDQNFLEGPVKEDVVIHRGIYQLVHALDFIHNRINSVHLDIQPKSVFITESSDWKLAGLGFLVKLPKDTEQAEYLVKQYDPRVPAFMHLQFDFTAPEIIYENSVSYKSDFFSLGILVYQLYTGQRLLATGNSNSEYKDEYNKFQRKVASMSWDTVFTKLPIKLRQCIPKLMNRDIYSRYDNITSFLESEFFQDPIIKTLNFLDDLPTKNNEDKLIFLDGLSDLLSKFPTALLQRKFLSVLLASLNQLCAEKVPNGRCIATNFDIVIKIGSSLSQLSFQERIYPTISDKIVFPILLQHATIQFIDNLSIIKEKIKQQDFLEKVLKPLITYVLQKMDGESAVLPQEKILDQTPLILETFDFLLIKNFFLPLISKLFTKTTSLKIKTMCITYFKILIEKKTIDNYIVCEDILPLFKSMKTRDPRILTKLLELFESIPSIVTDENLLVHTLLPLIWNYSMANTLNSSQYGDFTKVINKISTDIQKHHLNTLQKVRSNDTKGGAKAFSRIIDSEVKPKQDKDAEMARKVQAPVMQPTRNVSNSHSSTVQSTRNISSSSSIKSNSVLTPTNTSSIQSPGLKSPPQNNTFNISQNNTQSTFASRSNYQNPSSDTVKTLSSRLGDIQMNNNTLTPNNKSSSFSTYSNAQSSQSNNSSNILQPQNNNRVPANTSNFLSNQQSNNTSSNYNNLNNIFNSQTPMTPSNKSSNSSYPPGFSVPLQPNRKTEDKHSSDTDFMNGGSLI